MEASGKVDEVGREPQLRLPLMKMREDLRGVRTLTLTLSLVRERGKKWLREIPGGQTSLPAHSALGALAEGVETA